LTPSELEELQNDIIRAIENFETLNIQKKGQGKPAKSLDRAGYNK
jgi:hypothetical protein